MKKIIIAAALFLSFGAVLHAEEKTPQPPAATQASAADKDECILNAKDCGDQAISLESKINRLKQEIAKGTKVYTTKELRKLRNKLEDANDILDELLFHPTNN
jgi:Skp family chaperone for outer membrane proteins